MTRLTDEQLDAAFAEACKRWKNVVTTGEVSRVSAPFYFTIFEAGWRSAIDAIEAELSKQELVARPRLPRIDHFAREAFEKFASGVECELTNYRWFEAGWDARGDTVAAAPLPSAPAQSITDYMMDLVDRLGHEAENVDPKAWQHLLVYAPKPSAPDTVQVPDPKPRWFDI